MHLIKTEQSVGLYDGGEVCLGQSPGRCVILSAADTELGLLARAVEQSGRDGDAVRLANTLALSHPHSVEHFIEDTLRHAEIIVVRLLGGASYWRGGVEALVALADEKNIPLALLPGDGKPDPELDRLSTLDGECLSRLNAYLVEGGMDNAMAFLDCLDDITSGTDTAPAPRPLVAAGLYWPEASDVTADDLMAKWRERGLGDAPRAAVVFYRALAQSGDTEAVDGLLDALMAEGLAPLPVFVRSLKDEFSAGIVANVLAVMDTKIILNLTGFATSAAAGNSDKSPGPFGAVDVPVLQVLLASTTMAHWQGDKAGLNPRDLAMNVVLPELDGRIASRAVGFKAEPQRHELTQGMITRMVAHPERARFTARLAAGWVRLGRLDAGDKKLGIILANYPNRDSRIANGVGLDTPQSAVGILRHLKSQGYRVMDAPASSGEFIDKMLTAPSNEGFRGREVEAWLPLDEYQKHYEKLPAGLRTEVEARWGAPQSDPMFGDGGFAMPVRVFGAIAVAIQPARGYNIDPKASYHAPDLPTPHNYIAFYIWLREIFGVHAVIHLGKHGNLEWLPGKALALSDACFPDAILGATPHLYPFIVNDPGEGSQAKRRNAAVILDHLTPPMTLADSHGVMAELEALMDEYFEAAGLDHRREHALMDAILMTASRARLTDDCGIEDSDSADEKLLKLDNFLCDLKEMQIRDGLHIYGVSPEGRLRDDLTASILRIPRGTGDDGDSSILRALAHDLGLHEFDPLLAERGEEYKGAKPKVLQDIVKTAWRHNGDTVERLNALASALISGTRKPDQAWQKTKTILEKTLPKITSAIAQSGRDEMRFLGKALGGGFVPPAPSGAPTRGRIEVLPTGRNFFSVDSRAVPTPTAWRIGWAAASALIERFVADHGSHPKAFVLTAWGTANMRTGGDDIAQALALMGVEPEWDEASRRLTGFNVLPVSVLGRPRVDVTLRCSGFFRDAFPAQIALVDKVARTVGALDEDGGDNPIAARMKSETESLISRGVKEEEAKRMAGYRVFSAKPGAYGAGLQTLIDEGIWERRDDFAEAFLVWSGYAYGDENEGGVAARGSLEARLGQVDGVVHNQDNREHDILDSDDYYQFAGGLAASVAAIKGSDAPVYMGDHSLPERPKVRALGEEITRVVRGRATNPKWLRGVMRHGYKGAFEIAASLDYLFAFAATTNQVPGHLFDACFAAWVEDDEVRGFIEQANPRALDDMLARFHEAIVRGLWQPRRNSVLAVLESRGHNKQKSATA